MYKFLFAMFVSLYFVSSATLAQVYKCVDQTGKVSFGENPCQNGKDVQKLIKIKMQTSDSTDVKRDWAQENRDFKIRQSIRLEKESSERNRSNSRAAVSNSIAQSDKQLIASCEANRGVRCSDPYVIAKNRMANTPLTKAEQQNAINERRQRERQ